MDYLNHGKCSGECTSGNRFKFGNLVTESVDKVFPDSEPVYADFVWEDSF